MVCRAVLTADSEIELKSGDLIVCSNCGESNDYQSVIDVAREKGIEEVKKDFRDEIRRTLGKTFKIS